MSAQERLKVVIDGVSDGAQKAFDDVAKGARTTSDKLKSAGKQSQRFGNRVTRGISGPLLGAGAALVGTATKAARQGDAIAKAADRAGFATDAYQEWQYALGQSGMSAEETEKTIGRLNQRMADGSLDVIGPYSKAFEELGVNVKDSSGEMRSADDVFEESMEALAGVASEADQARLAGRIFGTRMGRQVLPALRNGADGMRDLRQEARDAGLVMGEDSLRGAEDFTDAMSTLRQQFGMVVTRIGNKVIPIVTDKLVPAFQDHVVPAIDKVGGAIERAVEWFINLDPKVQGIIGGILGFAAVLGPAAIVVGKLLVVLGGLASGFGSVIKVIGIVSKLLMANPWGIAIAAVAALAYAVYKHWDEIKAAVQAAIEFVMGIIGPWVEQLRALVGGWLDENRQAFSETWEAIKGYIATAIEVIKGVIDAAVSFLTTLWSVFGDDIMAIAATAWDYIKGTVENVITIVQGIIETVMAVIRGDWGAAWDGIKTVLSGVWEQIKLIVQTAIDLVGSVISGVLEGIKATWNAAWDTVTGAVSGAWDDITTAVASGIGDVLSWVRDLPGRILSAIGDLGSLLWSAGWDIIDGFIGGITSGFDRVRDTLGNLTSMLPDWKGPEAKDRVILSEPGELLMQGLGEGIEGGMSKVRAALSRVTDEVRDQAGDALDGQVAGHSLERSVTRPRGRRGGGRQTVVVELDGRVLARAIGSPLSDELRVRLGR